MTETSNRLLRIERRMAEWRIRRKRRCRRRILISSYQVHRNKVITEVLLEETILLVPTITNIGVLLLRMIDSIMLDHHHPTVLLLLRDLSRYRPEEPGEATTCTIVVETNIARVTVLLLLLDATTVEVHLLPDLILLPVIIGQGGLIRVDSTTDLLRDIRILSSHPFIEVLLRVMRVPLMERHSSSSDMEDLRLPILPGSVLLRTVSSLATRSSRIKAPFRGP